MNSSSVLNVEWTGDTVRKLINFPEYAADIIHVDTNIEKYIILEGVSSGKSIQIIFYISVNWLQN